MATKAKEADQLSPAAARARPEWAKARRIVVKIGSALLTDRATGALKLLGPHVVTHLPLPRIDSADVSITVAVENRSAAPVASTISARFDTVEVRKVVTLKPGVSEVVLDRLEGVTPAFSVIIIKGLASPELLMEVDITAVVSGEGA